MAVTVKEIQYKTLGKCVELSNATIELVITTDCGPRVIRGGFVGKANEFCEDSPAVQETYGNSTWKMRGGHRLWHSPEYFPRTYMPDNEAVAWNRVNHGIRVVQECERWVQIQKSMEITLQGDNKVRVKHCLLNRNAWAIEVAAWAITVMAPGGTAVVAQPSRDTGFLSNRVLALWPYSKMNDHRVYWGEKYITLTQDLKQKQPFKFGIANEAGWAAYFNHGNLFIKRHTHTIGGTYPDFGVSYETYTNDFMLEMETLSPVVKLEPESSLLHEEEWEFIAGIPLTDPSEDNMDAVVKKYIR
ncbi:hypothetical protein P22_0735 [Propionispora sp. 2/2-37]|uniref:hypothetical protein n=1 Tax=Propionispora sp. 2/2-37 TaxID=1677858 RepID=UPI0006BB661E|nr:hypothetical protein [Propionispora sp. 2/2-37]CUH94669.1 hypothetical protein P22_0735 [Propionispora sp. 2/2-37]